MNSMILKEGIRLNAFEETRFKSEYLSLNLLCPSELIKVGASALLPSVISQANARYPDSVRLNRALEEAYNTSFACRMFRIGDTRIQPFAVSWLSDRYVPDGFGTEEFALGFLRDCLLEPKLENGVFPVGELQNQIRNRIDDLNAEKNNKQRYAIKQCVRLMCEGDPFSIPLGGSEKELQNTSARDLYDYYRTILEKAPIEIYYFGRKNGEQIGEEIVKRFSPLFTEKGCVPPDVPAQKRGDIVHKTESALAQQSVLCLGYKTEITLCHPLHAAQVVMKEILSDSPVSLLFTEVREKESLCYYCSSLSETGKGLFIISAGVDRKNAKRAKQAILEQIERLKRGEFSDDLLYLAKKALINSYKDLYDSPAYLEAWYLRRRLAGREDAPLDMAKRVEAVTKEMIVACAEALMLDTVFLLDGRKGGPSHE
ncbi:MAG: insulinase family protein [Clostridia bacterium]|nr:insulinase family protein [Clostridia bacterium]